MGRSWGKEKGERRDMTWANTWPWQSWSDAQSIVLNYKTTSDNHWYLHTHQSNNRFLTNSNFLFLFLLFPRERNNLLTRVKEESGKAGLELNIQKTKIMASGPITSWWIDGETMETVTEFILGAPKSLPIVTAAMKLKDACSLEEKLWPT